MFGRLFRYLTFLLAAAGFVLITLVMQKIYAQETVKLGPPPVAPPRKPYQSTLAATGIIEALRENVAIGVPTSGLVMAVDAKVNDRVKSGQPLFKLDDREIQAQLIAQHASVEVSRTTVAVKKATLAKMEDLLSRMQAVQDARAISQDDLKTRFNDAAVARADVAASEAQLKAAEAQVKQSEILQERLTVRAPRDGAILQVNIRAGEYASTAPKEPAMYLGELDDLQIRADVDEQNATRVRENQTAVAYVKGDTTHPIELKFVRIEPYIIPKVSLTGASTERVDTRVLQMIYSLHRPASPRLYVGQQVDVYIDAGAAPALH